MRVLVLSPADSFTDSSLPELGQADDVAVVCWSGGSAGASGRIALRRSPFADRVARLCAGSVVLRTLLRASPLDPGVVFWRAVRSSPEAARAAKSADVLVAPERDGAFAAWSVLRRVRRGDHAPATVSGYPAARAAIERMR